MKHIDTLIIPKILTHLWVCPLVADTHFELIPLASSMLWLRSVVFFCFWQTHLI